MVLYNYIFTSADKTDHDPVPQPLYFQEAEVLSYCPQSKNIEVRLSTNQLPPPKRYGKFELHYDNGMEEEETQKEELPKEEDNLVRVANRAYLAWGYSSLVLVGMCRW